jgi:hypothetical protein
LYAFCQICKKFDQLPEEQQNVEHKHIVGTSLRNMDELNNDTEQEEKDDARRIVVGDWGIEYTDDAILAEEEMRKMSVWEHILEELKHSFDIEMRVKQETKQQMISSIHRKKQLGLHFVACLLRMPYV